jgi:LEA14-like dessication related protein
MRALVILTLLVGVLVCAPGCAGQKGSQIEDAGEVTAEYDGLDFVEQSCTGRTLSFKFEVANGTRLAKAFDNVKYTFSFNGKDVADTQSPVALDIAPGKKGTFEIRVKVEYPTDPKEYMDFIRKRSAPYKLNGVLSGAGGEVPVKAEHDMGLPELPDVHIPGAAIASGEKGEVGFTFDIFVKNRNVFPMKVDFVSYDLQIEGVPVGSGRIAEMEKVPPTSDLAYTFPAMMDLKTHGARFKDILGKKSMNWTLSGVLSVEGIALPVQKSGTITFTR